MAAIKLRDKKAPIGSLDRLKPVMGRKSKVVTFFSNGGYALTDKAVGALIQLPEEDWHDFLHYYEHKLKTIGNGIVESWLRKRGAALGAILKG